VTLYLPIARPVMLNAPSAARTCVVYHVPLLTLTTVPVGAVPFERLTMPEIPVTPGIGVTVGTVSFDTTYTVMSVSHPESLLPETLAVP